MTNEDLIKTSAVAGAVGFGLSSIYHAKQNKPYDDRSKTIYESLVDCYLEHIASPIPPEWEVRKEEGKIKPINCVKDIDVVKDLARRLRSTKNDIERNINSRIQSQKLNIVQNIYSLLDIIIERYNKTSPTFTRKSFKEIFGLMPKEPQPDGPELMFINEFAVSILNNPLDELDFIQKRVNYLNKFLRGAISRHENKHKNTFSTFKNVSQHINEIKNLLTQESEKNLRKLLTDFIDQIELQNEIVLNIVYSCCKDSNKLFNLANFMSEAPEALKIRKHRIGHTLYLIFQALEFQNFTDTSKIKIESVHRINRTILTNFSASEKDVYSINEIGVKEFLKDNNTSIDYFKKNNYEKIYDDIVNLLKDVVSLFYHIKVIHSINVSMPSLGVHTFLTNKYSVSAIKTVVEISEKTFKKLGANTKKFKEELESQLENINKKKLDIQESTQIPDEILSMYNNNMVKANEKFIKYTGEIKEFISNYQANPRLAMIERVDLLKQIFFSTLDCIKLQTEQNNNAKDKYDKPRKDLEQALSELMLNDDYDEHNNIIRKSNTAGEVSIIKSKNIEEICDIMTKPNQIFALRDNVITKHKFRSKLLEEIYNKIILEHKWALHRWEWFSICWGTYNNKQFFQFYDIINTTIRTIENSPGNQTELAILENIVELYVQKSQSNFFRSPPEYSEKSDSITAEYNDGCSMSIKIADSCYQVPISLFSQEFVDILGYNDNLKEMYKNNVDANNLLRSEIEEKREQIQTLVSKNAKLHESKINSSSRYHI